MSEPTKEAIKPAKKINRIAMDDDGLMSEQQLASVIDAEMKPLLAAEREKVIGKCKWKFDVHTGSYDTSCDNKFLFINGALNEHGFKYCPFCGGSLKPEGK